MLHHVQRFYSEIWEAGNRESLPEICHPDFRFRGSLGRDCIGHEAFWEYVQSVRSGLSDYCCKIEASVGEANRVFAKMRFSGFHTGRFMEFEPTGREVHWRGAALFTFEDGLVSELWVLGDVDALKQLLQKQSKGGGQENQ